MIIKGFTNQYGRPLYFDSACITNIKSYWDQSYDSYHVGIRLTSGISIIMEKHSGIRHNGVDIVNDGTAKKADEITNIIGEIMILERG